MSAAVASEAGELLRELRRLCDQLPVPQPSWHSYVAQIADCRTDFAHSLDLAARHPAVLELVAALIDGSVELGFDVNAPHELTAVWRRLEALPLPSGQHPYLDEILPALEGHRLLLLALSHTVGS